MNNLIETLLALSDNIRYVAIYQQGEFTSSSRSGILSTSSSESDKYEELIVNPTLLTLVTQRGNIDCGGVSFVLVRYGNFYQVIMPIPTGHISISIELHTNPLELIGPIRNILEDYLTSNFQDT